MKSRNYETTTEPIYVTLTERKDFDTELSYAISEGLETISAVVAPVLRAYLDDAVKCEIGRMKAKSTLKDVKALEKGLQRMFGFGAKVFEKKILEILYARLSIDFEPKRSCSFSDAVRKAKRKFDLQNLKKRTSERRLRPSVKPIGTRKG